MRVKDSSAPTPPPPPPPTAAPAEPPEPPEAARVGPPPPAEPGYWAGFPEIDPELQVAARGYADAYLAQEDAATGPGYKRTPARVGWFLAYLDRSKSITIAAAAIGIHRNTYSAWRKDDPAFSRLADHVFTAHTEELRVGMMHRAIHGFDEPVYQMGELAGYKRVYCTTLQMFMLRHRDPEYDSSRKLAGREPAAALPTSLKELAERLDGVLPVAIIAGVLPGLAELMEEARRERALPVD